MKYTGFLLLILFTISCSFHKTSKIDSPNNYLKFKGNSFQQRTPELALEKAKNQAINKIFNYLGVTVSLNSSLKLITYNNEIILLEKDNQVKTSGKYKISFIEKSFNLKTINNKNGESFYNGEIIILFKKEDFNKFWINYANINYNTLLKTKNSFLETKNYKNIIAIDLLLKKINKEIPIGIISQIPAYSEISSIKRFIKNKKEDLNLNLTILINSENLRFSHNNFIFNNIPLLIFFDNYQKNFKIVNSSVNFDQEDYYQFEKSFKLEFENNQIISSDKTNIIRLSKPKIFILNNNFLEKEIYKKIKKNYEISPKAEYKIEIKQKSKIIKSYEENLKTKYIATTQYSIFIINSEKKKLIYEIPNQKFIDNKGIGDSPQKALQKSKQLDRIENLNALILEITKVIKKEKGRL